MSLVAALAVFTVDSLPDSLSQVLKCRRVVASMVLNLPIEHCLRDSQDVPRCVIEETPIRGDLRDDSAKGAPLFFSGCLVA